MLFYLTEQSEFSRPAADFKVYFGGGGRGEVFATGWGGFGQ